MIFECLVIDNSNFFKDGTIRVRIKDEVSSRVMMKDMSDNPEESINHYGNQRYERYGDEREFKYDDEDVRLMSPIGGAYDYGMFILPQPNTWGLVTEIGSRWEDHLEPRMAWIGSLSMFNMQTKDIDIPSDKIESKNGCNKGDINIDSPYSGLVFKQKETHISESSENIDDKSKETLNWKKRPTQNMVVLNNDQIIIYHNNNDKNGDNIGNTKIILNEKNIELSTIVNEGKTSKLSLNNEGGFDLVSTDEEAKTSNIISSNSESVSISHNYKGSSTNLSMGSGYNGEAICSLSLKDGDKIPCEIILNGKNGITINSNNDISVNPGSGKNVTLGTGEGYILTTNSPGTWNFDNHTVTAVKNAKA